MTTPPPAGATGQRFYVSFVYHTPGGMGFLGIEVHMTRPPSGNADLNQLAADLTSRGYPGATVLAFSPLANPRET